MTVDRAMQRLCCMAGGAGARNQATEMNLSDFVHAHRDEIVAAWERAVRNLPKARDLDRPALIDHIPEMLDHIARMADELGAGGSPQLPDQVAELHAIARLSEASTSRRSCSSSACSATVSRGAGSNS